jgi:hypothetical protein
MKRIEREDKPAATDPIKDRMGRIYTVNRYPGEIFDSYFVFTRFGTRVAKAFVNVYPNSAVIADLEVCETRKMPWKDILSGYPREFRKQGIGGQLLKIVLRDLDAEKIPRVWGIVTEKDQEKFGELVRWYRTFNFREANDAEIVDIPKAPRPEGTTIVRP